MDAIKRFIDRKTVEILSVAEFNDVGNAHQGKGLTLWCGGREVEAPATWQVAIFLDSGATIFFGCLIDGRMYPAPIPRDIV
jgi:hypothetical protein